MVNDSVNSVPMWSIRTIDEDIDVYRMYGNNENLFSMKIHYAGMFTPQPGRAYVNGNSAKVKLYYHFRKPDGDLDTGMHALGNDHDVRKFANRQNINLKLEEVNHTYNDSTSVIKEIEDDVMLEMQITKLKPRKPVKGQSAKKLMLKWIGKPNVGVVDHDNDFVPFLDLDRLDVADREIPQFVGKGKSVLETVEEDEIARGGGNETETNNVINVEEGSDSEDDSDSGQGSESESSDGNDSGELVDDENPVEYVQVDMDTFDKSNVDTLDVDDRHGEFNANEEIDVDLDVIHNEEFESASYKDGLDRVRGIIPVFKPTSNHGLSQGDGPSQVTAPINKLGSTPKEKWTKAKVSASKGTDYSLKSGSQSRSVGPKTLKALYGCLSAHAQIQACLDPPLSKSKIGDSETWQVKTYDLEHKCLQSRKIKYCTANLLFEGIMDQIESNLKIPIKAIQDQLQKKYQVEISRMKAFRAKSKVVDHYTRVCKGIHDEEDSDSQKSIAKCVRPLTPTATRLFQAIKDEASEYTCNFNGGHLYGVFRPWQDQQVMDVLHWIHEGHPTFTTSIPLGASKKRERNLMEKTFQCGSSGRNVAAKKTKTANSTNPTQASQSTQASTSPAMRKNKGKAIADSSQKSGMQVRRSQRNVLKLG
ncbi:hypothetical protein Tco_0761685 [Tanacetum coccineum]